MKKFFTALALMLVMATSLSATVFAANNETLPAENTVEITVEQKNGEKSNMIIDLNTCARLETDQSGNAVPQPRISLSQHTIGSGNTMEYYNTNGDFQINRGAKVTFKANFKSSISWECGYSSDSYTSSMGSGSGSSFSKTATMPADGAYRFYITNESPDTVTVSSGSINY